AAKPNGQYQGLTGQSSWRTHQLSALTDSFRMRKSSVNTTEDEIALFAKPGPFTGMVGIETQRIGATIAGIFGCADAEAIIALVHLAMSEAGLGMAEFGARKNRGQAFIFVRCRPIAEIGQKTDLPIEPVQQGVDRLGR